MDSLLIPQEKSYFFSSSPSLGATNIVDGTRFSVDMTHDKIGIPKGAKNATLSVEYATIPNTVSNIITNVNDVAVLVYNSVVYVIVLPEGSYGIDDINTYINEYMSNAVSSWDNFIVIGGDVSTQKTKIKNKNALLTRWDTNYSTRNSAFGALLGWDIGQYPFTASNQTHFSQNPARLNVISEFYLHSNIINNGLSNNGNYYNILGRIPITVKPSSTQNYEPLNPVRLDAYNLVNDLSGKKFDFWITNELNEAIKLPQSGGEFMTWSFGIKLQWFMPMNVVKI